MHDIFERHFGIAAGRHFKKYITSQLAKVHLHGARVLEFGDSGMAKRLSLGFGAIPQVIREEGGIYESCRKMLTYDPEERFRLVLSDCLLQKCSEIQKDMIMKKHAELCEKGGYVLIVVPGEGAFSRVSSALGGGEGMKLKELLWLIERASLTPLKSIQGPRFISVLCRKE